MRRIEIIKYVDAEDDECACYGKQCEYLVDHAGTLPLCRLFPSPMLSCSVLKREGGKVLRCAACMEATGDA
jgi:hypothetical protein